MKLLACCLCVVLLAAVAAGCGSGGGGSTSAAGGGGDPSVTVAPLGAECGEGLQQASPNVCVNPADPRSRQVADLIERLRKRYKLKASIFGVWYGEDQLVTAAAGEALPGVPATRDLHFRMCNVTEQMTTTLFLKYVDEGRLSLDDPVSKWFPSLPRANQVTLRMLASSTSGIADYVTSNRFVNAFHRNPFRQWQPEELVRIGARRPPVFAPGKSWAFSDTNFVLLGEILTKAGGKPLGDQLREKILDPLGLRETAMHDTAQVPPPVLHGYDPERGDYQDSTFWSPSWGTYTINMTSNLADMGAWAPALGTGALLSDESYQLQVGPGNVGLGPLTQKLYYGMGVGVASSWILSNPHCAGYNGIVAYYPPEKISFVLYSTPDMGNPDGINYSQQIFIEVTKLLTPGSVPDIPQRED
jgi:D-alanyl-D-alanine carboxypeptidase